MITRYFSFIGFAGFLLASLNVASANSSSDVEINGRILSSKELVSLESRLSTRIGPGRYLVDPQSGCWLNITTGGTNCIGDPGLSPSRKVVEKRHLNRD